MNTNNNANLCQTKIPFLSFQSILEHLLEMAGIIHTGECIRAAAPFNDADGTEVLTDAAKMCQRQIKDPAQYGDIDKVVPAHENSPLPE
jgi:hypothetical protein